MIAADERFCASASAEHQFVNNHLLSFLSLCAHMLYLLRGEISERGGNARHI
jgi:hypothetical protein